jgi:hypothetical protein
MATCKPVLTDTIASGHGSQPNNDIERVTGKPAHHVYGLRSAQRQPVGWAAPVTMQSKVLCRQPFWGGDQ